MAESRKSLWLSKYHQSSQNILDQIEISEFLSKTMIKDRKARVKLNSGSKASLYDWLNADTRH